MNFPHLVDYDISIYSNRTELYLYISCNGNTVAYGGDVVAHGEDVLANCGDVGDHWEDVVAHW